MTTADRTNREAQKTGVTLALKSGLMPASAVVALFALMVWLWCALDIRRPWTDEAGHILNSLDYRDLLSHPRPWKGEWLQRFLSVNPFYPPLVHVFNGSLKLSFGTGRWVDELSLTLFSLVFSTSTYCLARRIGGSILAGVLAVTFVNLYPQVAILSHFFLLDFPLVAMVALGLLSLIWWGESPTPRRALACALAVSAACMTKQIPASYLISPGLFYCVRLAGKDLHMRRAVHLRQMLLMAVTGAVICLPWTLTNAGWIADFAKYNSSNITAVSGSGLRWLSNLGSYLSGFPPAMSLVLFSAWLASSTGISRQLHVRLIPLYLSLLGGILLLSTLSWAFPLDRYIAPALVVPAVMSGLGAAGLIRRQKIIFYPAICLVVATAFLQYLSFFFSPRPLDRPEFLTQFSTRLGIALREYRGAVIPRNFPTPPQDWGQEWALNLIRNTDKDTPAWLNILPSTCELNPHTFSLIARERGWKVRPTTSRVWTVMGDKVTFSPETALYYRWYLLKSGAQGNQLRDSESESDYQKLVSFVRQSGRFALVGEHRIPDREKLMLYRQR